MVCLDQFFELVVTAMDICAAFAYISLSFLCVRVCVCVCACMYVCMYACMVLYVCGCIGYEYYSCRSVLKFSACVQPFMCTPLTSNDYDSLSLLLHSQLSMLGLHFIHERDFGSAQSHSLSEYV